MMNMYGKKTGKHMKNKLLFIFLILIAVNLHPTSYSYGLDENTKNGVLSKAIIAFDDPHIRECGPDHNGNNVYPTMTDIYYSTLPKKKPPLDVITTIPDEFDWKNINGKDFTTPARNQGNVGTCWLFAALAILESNIEIRENCSILNPDLSEQYVLSCINGAGGVNGGSAQWHHT
jgi:C1A family cysteine protease